MADISNEIIYCPFCIALIAVEELGEYVKTPTQTQRNSNRRAAAAAME